ncbi:MAG: S-layer homology domain-containing protein, partial [Butyricicoccus sp.]
MKRTLLRLLSAVCAAGLLVTPAMAAGIDSFPDASGHWAYDALSRAVDDGLLQGDESGRLLPSGSLTVAQMTAILNRTLHAENTDRAYPGTPEGQWYTADAAKGASLGILPADGSLTLTADATRAEVFEALAAAFGLSEAEPDESVLSSFSDVSMLSPAQRRAAAVLVRDGIVSGAQDGSLQASRGITRAEFVSLIYRMLNGTYLPALLGDPAEAPEEIPETDVSETEIPEEAPETDAPATETPEEAPETDVSEPSAVSFFTEAPNPDEPLASRVVLRGNRMDWPFAEPIEVERLVLAATGTDVSLSAEQGSFGTVAVGGGTGTVSLSGEPTRVVEVTGSGRTVNLSGMALDTLLVSGVNNTILVDKATKIGTLKVLAGATGNKITMDGTVDSAFLTGSRSALMGAGHAGAVTLTGKHCTATLSADTVSDETDNGLDGVKLSVEALGVAPGGQITATVTITGVDKARVCGAQWYLDGEPDDGFVNSAFEITEGRTSSYRRAIEFTRNMKLTHTVGFVLTYQNPVTGETEKKIAGAEVQIENYPASHYLPTAAEVLAKVNPTYQAGNVDYTPEEKTVFVNAKGYSSKTQYLIWV